MEDMDPKEAGAEEENKGATEDPPTTQKENGSKEEKSPEKAGASSEPDSEAKDEARPASPLTLKVKREAVSPTPSSGTETPRSAMANTPAHKAVLASQGTSFVSSLAENSFNTSVSAGTNNDSDGVSLNILNDVGGAGMSTPVSASGKDAEIALSQVERVEKQENIKLLEQIPLLKNLHKWEKSKIAEHLQFRDYEEGDIIVLEGDEADEFYIVKDGVVDITRRCW